MRTGLPVAHGKMRSLGTMTRTLSTPRGPITIRPAVEADAAAVRALRLEGLRDHPAAFGSDYASSAAEPVDDTAKRIARAYAENTSRIFVAAAGDQLVALTGVHRDHRPKLRHSANIWGVYVRPAWRGLRLADELIAECLDWARQHGVTIAKLGVSATNIAAIRCYLRCGFSVYGVEPRALLVDGVSLDELLMARTLEDE